MDVLERKMKITFCYNFFYLKFCGRGETSFKVRENVDLFLYYLRIKRGILIVNGRSYRAGSLVVLPISPGDSVASFDLVFDGFMFPFYKLADQDRYSYYQKIIYFQAGSQAYESVVSELDFCKRGLLSLPPVERVLYSDSLFNRLDILLSKSDIYFEIGCELRLSLFIRKIIDHGYRYKLYRFCDDVGLGLSTVYRTTSVYGGYRRLKEFVCLKSVLYQLFQSSRSSDYDNLLIRNGFFDSRLFEESFFRRFRLNPNLIQGRYKDVSIHVQVQKPEFIRRLIYI